MFFFVLHRHHTYHKHELQHQHNCGQNFPQLCFWGRGKSTSCQSVFHIKRLNRLLYVHRCLRDSARSMRITSLTLLWVLIWRWKGYPKMHAENWSFKNCHHHHYHCLQLRIQLSVGLEQSFHQCPPSCLGVHSLPQQRLDLLCIHSNHCHHHFPKKGR